MNAKVPLMAGLLALSGVTVTVLGIAQSENADALAPRVVRIGEMSVARAAHQATRLGSGQVLVTGGCAAQGCERILASVEVYDPGTRSFRAVAPMTTPRASHKAIALPDGRVLVSGGWTGSRATASAEVYDPTTGRWTAVSDMAEARASHNALLLPDDRVLIVGTSAEVFDPATSTFSAVGSMRPDGGSYLPVDLADGRVLVTGGASAGGEVLRSAQIFVPATGEFQRTGDMIVPRYKHAAALLLDGTVLIIGGSDERDSRGRYASAEIYDPATGEFSPGPDMGWARFKIRDAVVVLARGSVVVAGGAVRAELFDPADGVFVPVEGEFSAPLMFATTTLLRTGEVLALGGYDDRIQPSASAWLIQWAR